MTFAEIQTAIKDYCVLTSTEATARVGRSINRHYRRITTQLGMDTTRFTTASATFSTFVATKSFSNIEQIDRIRDVTTATDIRLIPEVSLHELRSTTPHSGAPTKWATKTRTSETVTVLFDTAPAVAYNLEADGWRNLADLSGTDEPAFPESFHDILVWSVIAEEMLKKEKDERAIQYQAMADRLLAELRFHMANSPTRVVRQGLARDGVMDYTKGLQ